MKSDHLDPRTPEILACFATLPPKEELAARLALSWMCRHCDHDAAWNARLKTLQRRVRSPAAMKRITERAAEIGERLRAELMAPRKTIAGATRPRCG